MKQQYRIRNWSEYNAGLVKRGSLTFWVSEDVVEAWVSRDFTGDPGARGAKPVIPPRKNAVIEQHGNCKAPPKARDETLRSIRIFPSASISVTTLPCLSYS
jgi:hypothetical protein